MRTQTIKCPPLSESVQKWFNSLWSFDRDRAVKLYAKNFQRFKAEEFKRPLTMYGIDRGCYKGKWDHIVRIEIKRANDRPLPVAFPQFVKGKLGKDHVVFKRMGYEKVCRVLHGLDISLFTGDRANSLTGDERDLRLMCELEREKYVVMPVRERAYMKIAEAKWRHFSADLEKEGRMTSRNWYRALELQFIVWKLAGVEGTFNEFILKTKYKDLLVDRFFTVSERLLKAWRAMKLTGNAIIPDGQSSELGCTTPSDPRRSERRKLFPFLMEGESHEFANVQEDDDETVARSNCVSDKGQTSWEYCDDNDTLDLESNPMFVEMDQLPSKIVAATLPSASVSPSVALAPVSAPAPASASSAAPVAASALASAPAAALAFAPAPASAPDPDLNLVGEGLGRAQEPFKCARSDMTEKEENWYSLHWAFDLIRFRDKTDSGEYALARPPKKPGGMNSNRIFIVLLGMAIKVAQGFVKILFMLTGMTLASAQGFSDEGVMPATKQPEIVFCLMVSLFAYLLSRMRHSADRKEMLRRLKASRKRCSTGGEATNSAHRRSVDKSSKSRKRSGENKDSLPWDVNDKLLEEQLCETLDRDIERCCAPDKVGSTVRDDDCSGSVGLCFREFFDCEIDAFMAEFEFNGCGFAPYDEVKAEIWEMFRQKMTLLGNANILEPGWEGDPGDQIDEFLADLEEGVEEIFSTGHYEWEAAGRLYLQKLTQSKVISAEFRSDETELDCDCSTQPGETCDDMKRVGNPKSPEEEAGKSVDDPSMNQVVKRTDADREDKFRCGDFKIAFELQRKLGTEFKSLGETNGHSESREEDPFACYHDFSYIFEEGVDILLGLYDLENDPDFDDIMNCLLTKYNLDASLTEEDPERRIAEFLSRIDEEILSSVSCRNADMIGAGKRYFLEMHNAMWDKSKDDDTATTATDSSTWSSSWVSNEMYLLINGTRYVGSKSPTVSSVCAEAENSDEKPESGDRKSPVEETKKERNRRLLIQHRESVARAQKLNRENCLLSTSDHTGELNTIKEDECSDDSAVETLGPDLDDLDKLKENERRMEIHFFLERKFGSFVRVRRRLRRRRCKPAKNSPPANILRFDCWSEVVLSVAYVLLLFSSSAARYAMFRSLRRFKPED